MTCILLREISIDQLLAVIVAFECLENQTNQIQKKKNHFCILLENLVCFLLSISHILKIIKFSRRFPFQPHPPPPTPQNFVVTNIVRSYFFRFILCTQSLIGAKLFVKPVLLFFPFRFFVKLSNCFSISNPQFSSVSIFTVF